LFGGFSLNTQFLRKQVKYRVIRRQHGESDQHRRRQDICPGVPLPGSSEELHRFEQMDGMSNRLPRHEE